jgi:hypothetical protein
MARRSPNPSCLDGRHYDAQGLNGYNLSSDSASAGLKQPFPRPTDGAPPPGGAAGDPRRVLCGHLHRIEQHGAFHTEQIGHPHPGPSSGQDGETWASHCDQIATSLAPVRYQFPQFPALRDGEALGFRSRTWMPRPGWSR